MQAYIKAIELLIDLASLQTAFLTLDQAIKATNRRVNALDNVVKPRLENTIAYIKARLHAHPAAVQQATQSCCTARPCLAWVRTHTVPGMLVCIQLSSTAPCSPVYRVHEGAAGKDATGLCAG